MVTRPLLDPFAEAALKLFPDAKPGDTVGVDITGGGTVQIGDYTWDDEPIEIEIDLLRGARVIETRKFSTLPEVWTAIAEASR